MILKKIPSAPTPSLVSIMAANNEIGAIQPVGESWRYLPRSRRLFSTPTAVSMVRQGNPFHSVHQFNADLVSICAPQIPRPPRAPALSSSSRRSSPTPSSSAAATKPNAVPGPKISPPSSASSKPLETLRSQSGV